MGADVGVSLPGMLRAKDGPKQAHMDVLVAVPGRLTPTSVFAPKFKAKKTTKTKVVASNFVVYSDSVRRNPAANGVYRGMIAKSYF